MDNQSKPYESYASEDTQSTMDPVGQLDARSQTSHKRDGNYRDEPTDTPEAPSAALVRKRFSEFLDEPETWEKNLLPTQKSLEDDGGAQELSRLSERREEITNDAPECRSKRRRRNAIKPNSMTQRVAKDVADCHYLEENAVATGTRNLHACLLVIELIV